MVANVGCNDVGYIYSREGNQLSISWSSTTEVACTETQAEAEQVLIRDIPAGALTVSSDGLALEIDDTRYAALQS